MMRSFCSSCRSQPNAIPSINPFINTSYCNPIGGLNNVHIYNHPNPSNAIPPLLFDFPAPPNEMPYMNTPTPGAPTPSSTFFPNTIRQPTNVICIIDGNDTLEPGSCDYISMPPLEHGDDEMADESKTPDTTNPPPPIVNRPKRKFILISSDDEDDSVVTPAEDYDCDTYDYSHVPLLDDDDGEEPKLTRCIFDWWTFIIEKELGFLMVPGTDLYT